MNSDMDELARRDESVRALFAEMQASSFAHANTYVTVIVFGAYAGLFAIWSNVKERLSADMVYWTGLLIGLSMMCFVAFEIFKMVVVSRDMMAMRSLIVVDMSPEERDQRKKKLSASANYFINKVVIPIWVITLAVTGITGFGAAVLLMTAFIQGLAKA